MYKDRPEFEELKFKLHEVLEEFLDSREIPSALNVELASCLLASFPWETLSRVLPDKLNFFVQSGWIKSIGTGFPVSLLGDPIPWLNYQAKDFIDRFINSKRYVFEYGLGNSSLYFQRRGAEIFGVEGDTYWFHFISGKLLEAGYPTGRLKLESEREEYISSIGSWDIRFDIVIVDGGWREECILKAVEHINTHGLIVLDNSDSIEYEAIFDTMSTYGFERLDLCGIVPSLPFANTTTFFCRDFNSALKSAANLPPAYLQNYSSGLTVFQALNSTS